MTATHTDDHGRLLIKVDPPRVDTRLNETFSYKDITTGEYLNDFSAEQLNVRLRMTPEEYSDWQDEQRLLQINYIEGDATAPVKAVSPGTHYIVHCCNNVGGWGSGFVLALSAKWEEPERSYRAWVAGPNELSLGSVSFVPVEDDITVVNLIGQDNYRRWSSEPNKQFVRYDAIDSGFKSVASRILDSDGSVHMPRIGCGLAGGKWSEIEPLIQSRFIDEGIEVYVYDLPGQSFKD